MKKNTWIWIICLAATAAVDGCVAVRRPERAPEVATNTYLPPAGPSKSQEIASLQQSIRDVRDDLHFQTASDAIPATTRDRIGKIGGLLAKYPEEKIKVEGHTDSKGSASLNQKLSTQRAEMVAQILMDHGAKPNQVEVIGKGEQAPVASNKTADGRAENRRVELMPEPSATA